ncbi:MAG: transcriptional regulator [Scytonematopsis contorta HA4267-MV1]|jgi:HTH-type transcriptional regulator/antitoxin HigA|nr:transcriptional regulator [Scytonematopsis contorta HA4267-MV1]
MTITFNKIKYQELLIKYQPKIIRTEEENENFLKIIEELMHQKNLSPEEDELYDLLITLVEKFEQDYYSPGECSTPRSRLIFLMEQQDIKHSDLVGIIGSTGIVSEILNGNQEISEVQAKALGDFFKVDPSLFR